MVDMHLAARLFKAVSSETRIIVLGDKHQLAAVGPGAVFADISDESGALADCVVTLKTSRRFPEGTVISKLAKAINHEAGLRGRPQRRPPPKARRRSLKTRRTTSPPCSMR